MSANKYFGQSTLVIDASKLELLSSIPVQAIPYMSALDQNVNTVGQPRFSKLGINQTAGTRELEVNGTILTKQGASSTQSANLLIGGDTDFTSSTGNWTDGSNGWLIGGGVYTHTANATPNAYYTPQLSLTEKAFRIEMKITTTTVGTFQIMVGATPGRDIGRTVGTIVDYVDYFETGFNPTTITLIPSITWAGSIDYIKAYSITANVQAINITTSNGELSIGSSNVYSQFIGTGTGTYATTATSDGTTAIGSYNSYFGSGKYCVSLGLQSLYHNSGNFNTSCGVSSLQNNTIGIYNTSVGYSSTNSLVIGDGNVCIGANSLASLTEGNYNTCLGYGGGNSIGTGSNNIVIGKASDVSSSTTTNAIAIGVGAIAPTNQTVLGNSSTTMATVYGNIKTNSGDILQKYAFSDKQAGEIAVTTWTSSVSSNEANGWVAVEWSPELRLFCAVATSGTNRIMTSPDGKTWTARTNDLAGWTSICWSPLLNKFCAVGNSGTSRVSLSSDGITWTAYTSVAIDAKSWQSVCWSPKLQMFVACANDTPDGNKIMLSYDGITWEHKPTPDLAVRLTGVTWSPELELFCTCSAFSAPVMTSPDAINWTIQAVPIVKTWTDLCWSSDLRLFVICSDATAIITSPDGITWTSRTSVLTTAQCVKWASGLGLFVMVAFNGTNRIATSFDGITWLARTPSGTGGTYGIAYSPELNQVSIVAFNGAPRTQLSRTISNKTIRNSQFAKVGVAQLPGVESLEVAGNIKSTGSITTTNIIPTTTNCLFGISAGSVITTGIDNVIIGNTANTYANNTNNSVTIGSGAIASVNSVVIGKGAKCTTTSALIIGYTASSVNMVGTSNTIIGNLAGQSVTTGSDVVLLGYGATLYAGSSSNATVLGSNASSANDSVSVGSSAKTYSQGVSVGHLAGTAMTTGAGNTCVGYSAGNTITYSANNTIIGNQADVLLVSTGNSVAIGNFAISGTWGVAVGDKAKCIGVNGVSIGASAGLALTSGINCNTLIGYESGKTITTGYDNTLVGHGTGTLNIGTYNAIGIGKDVICDNNEIKIGNSSHTTCYLQGITSTGAPYTGLCPLYVNPTTGQMYRGAVI